MTKYGQFVHSLVLNSTLYIHSQFKLMKIIEVVFMRHGNRKITGISPFDLCGK